MHEIIEELKHGIMICDRTGTSLVHVKRTTAENIITILMEQKQPEWVSVKDRLPEKLTPVLVCNHGIYDIAFIGDKGNWVNKLFEPEYWMYIPKPPKEVSE